VLIFWKKEPELWIIALKMFIFMARKSGVSDLIQALRF